MGINESNTNNNEYKKEYNLIKENENYNFIIEKSEDLIIIKCNNYKINLNNNDITKLTNLTFKTIDIAYTYIINKIDKKEFYINDIIKNKEKLKLLLKKNEHYNNNEEFELLLNDKDILSYFMWLSQVSSIFLDNFEPDKINERYKEKHISHFYENGSQNNSNNKNFEFEFVQDLTSDSYIKYFYDNSFTVFNSINFGL